MLKIYRKISDFMLTNGSRGVIIKIRLFQTLFIYKGEFYENLCNERYSRLYCRI